MIIPTILCPVKYHNRIFQINNMFGWCPSSLSWLDSEKAVGFMVDTSKLVVLISGDGSTPVMAVAIVVKPFSSNELGMCIGR